MQLDIIDLGRIAYRDALKIQNTLLGKRQREEIQDTLLLLEHEPVITLGKRAENKDLLTPQDILESRGIDVVWIDRGGQATFHGPGQLVGYPIIHLRNHERKLKRFVHNLEEVIIRLLDEKYGLEAHTEKDYVGVWIENRKAAAIGISVHQKVTMHGFALNVNTDLDFFSHIVPCGIRSDQRGITSISRELGRVVEVNEVMHAIIPLFTSIYGYDEICFTRSREETV